MILSSRIGLTPKGNSENEMDFQLSEFAASTRLGSSGTPNAASDVRCVHGTRSHRRHWNLPKVVTGDAEVYRGALCRVNCRELEQVE